MSASTARADAMIAWFRDWAPRRLDSRLMDERRTVPPHVVLELGAQGFFGLQVPEALGGQGLGAVDMARVLEQVAAADVTLGVLLGIHNGLGLPPLLGHAAPALRDRWVPALASGRALASFALTEPGAGSNPAAITTRAVRVDGGWRVTGQKRWTGLASWAAVITVFAQAVDPDGRPLGLIALLLEAGDAGLEHGPESLTMGVRGIVQNEVRLADAFVPDDRVLGAPGAGLAMAHGILLQARLGIAAGALGAMKRSLQELARWAGRRAIAGGQLSANPQARAEAAELVAACGACEALVYLTARLADAGGAPTEAYLACKAIVPELAFTACDRTMQLLGGRGYIEPNGVPQRFRDLRLLRIFEGPSEVLTAHLGTLALAKPRGLRTLLATHAARPDVAEALFAALARLPRDAEPAWLDLQAGALAAAAVLWAVAPDDAWGRKRFERLTWSAAPPLDPWGPIAAYAAAIGVLTAAPPGEDQALDPLLRLPLPPGEGARQGG